MKHVILFGGSGFIGSHVHSALAGDPRVERVSVLGRDDCDLIAAGADQLTELLARLRPSAVVNCTGRLDGTVAELRSANTAVTCKLIDAIADIDPAIRLVRIGSAGEYGPVPHGRAVTEDDPTAPVAEYGRSHLAATLLVEAAAFAERADGITLRVFNPIGAGMPAQTVLGQAAQSLLAAQASGAGSIILGPLGAWRDFVDARDVAAAVVAAVVAPTLPYRTLNVGSGRAVTVRSAVALLARAAGFAGEIHEQGAETPRSATVDWMLADISRTESVLGWRPVHDLADSVKAVWATAGAA